MSSRRTSKQTISNLIVTNLFWVFILVGILIRILVSYFGNSFEELKEPIKLAGNFFISTGLVGVPYSIYMWRSFRKESVEVFQKSLKKTNTLFKSASKYGIIFFQSELIKEKKKTKSNFSKEIKNAKTIRILDTWIGKHQTILDKIERKFDIDNEKLSLKKINKIKEKKVSIKILLSSKDFAEYRAEDLYQKRDNINFVNDGVTSSLERLEKIKEIAEKVNSENKVEVKIYSSTPTMPLYWIDDICYIGFFWRNKFSAENFQIKVDMSKKSALSNNIRKHFYCIWNLENPADRTVNPLSENDENIPLQSLSLNPLTTENIVNESNDALPKKEEENIPPQSLSSNPPAAENIKKK